MAEMSCFPHWNLMLNGKALSDHKKLIFEKKRHHLFFHIHAQLLRKFQSNPKQSRFLVRSSICCVRLYVQLCELIMSMYCITVWYVFMYVFVCVFFIHLCTCVWWFLNCVYVGICECMNVKAAISYLLDNVFFYMKLI